MSFLYGNRPAVAGPSNADDSDDEDIYSKLGLDRTSLADTYVDPYEENDYCVEELTENQKEQIRERLSKFEKNTNVENVISIGDKIIEKRFRVPRIAEYRQNLAHQRNQRSREKSKTIDETIDEITTESQQAENQTLVRNNTQTKPVSETICQPILCDPSVWREDVDVMNHIFSNDKDVRDFYLLWYPKYYQNIKSAMKPMSFRDMLVHIGFGSGYVESVTFFNREIFESTNEDIVGDNWPVDQNVVRVTCKFNEMDPDTQKSADKSWETHDTMMSDDTLLSYARDCLRCNLVFTTTYISEDDKLAIDPEDDKFQAMVVTLVHILFYIFVC